MPTFAHCSDQDSYNPSALPTLFVSSVEVSASPGGRTWDMLLPFLNLPSLPRCGVR